jgi:diketogulonate reductase-like aldo/keto reductase
MQTLTLNKGVDLPALGLGVFQTPPDDTRDAVRAALGAGYRHIDTAAPTATSARSARRCIARG